MSFNSDLVQAQYNLGISLMETGYVEKAVEHFDRVIALHPTLHPHVATCYLYAIHYHPEFHSQKLDELKSLGASIRRAAEKQIQPHRNDRSANRRLRIGYVSRFSRLLSSG